MVQCSSVLLCLPSSTAWPDKLSDNDGLNRPPIHLYVVFCCAVACGWLAAAAAFVAGMNGMGYGGMDGVGNLNGLRSPCGASVCWYRQPQ